MSLSQEPPPVQAHMLLDEIEQLRTSLESALEENASLVEDRDRLLRRVTTLARELQLMQLPPPPVGLPRSEEAERDAQTEELRVAFEELQVLTEELEVANNGLFAANRDLDAKVEERTHQLHNINAALRTTEGSLRSIANLVPDLLWRMDGEGQADWFNSRWFDYTGHDPDASLGDGWLRIIHPLDLPDCRERWARSMATGKPYQQEQRMRDAAGAYRWFLVRAEPMLDEGGGIANWFAAGTDVDERRAAMEALQQSELRFRTLVEGMPQLVWRAVGAGRWTWCSPQWTAFTGQSEQDSHGMGWLDMVHPEDRDAARDAWARAQDLGRLEMEVRIRDAAHDSHRQFRTRALPVRNDVDIIVEWLGTSTNVQDIWQLRQQQSVLVAELQHRTRNLMAIVRSIAIRTLKCSKDLTDFGKYFDDRLRALARVQSLLSQREAGLRVPFDALLREELSAHVPLDINGGDQISLEGPPGISLRSSIVQTLALALHELATNAVKYGALSRPDAHLHVSWGLKRSDDEANRLWVDWRETGVDIPDAHARPQGGGYGRELIEQALPYQMGAATGYKLEDGGVHCTIEIEVPGDEIAADPAQG